jgi:hypothetical protein
MLLLMLPAVEPRPGTTGGSTMAAGIGAGKGPVLATKGDGANLTLGGIVGHARPSVIEEACQNHPAR